MSITFDHISMPPKSQEVSQIQGADQIRYEHNQQENAAQFQEVVRQQSETAVRRKEAENDPDRYDKDEKRKKNRDRKGSSRGKQKQKQEEDTKAASNEGHFDIRV